MIIELKLKNWKSFRNETVFSLAATDERRLKARTPRIRKNPALSVLPISVLYGGNASGKTNFFSIFQFLKFLIIAPLHDEEKEIPLDVFSLDNDSQITPTEISLSFLAADDKIYTFDSTSLEINDFKTSIINLEEKAIFNSGPSKIHSLRNV